MNKPLARPTKKGGKKTQITNNRTERENIATGHMDIKRIIKKYYKQLYATTFDNLGEMD